MYRRRAQFAVHLPSPEEAFRHLRKSQRPAAILEPSDNPLSGGVADTTGLLRALVEHGREYRAVFAFFWDPDLVTRCAPGRRMNVRLGARLADAWGPPVALEVEVERVTDGRFRNAGPMEKGLEVSLGRTAVLRAGMLRIIVTQSCQAPNDAEYFRLHGIDLGEVDLVCAKAKNHFRAAFGEVFDPIIEVDTAGAGGRRSHAAAMAARAADANRAWRLTRARRRATSSLRRRDAQRAAPGVPPTGSAPSVLMRSSTAGFLSSVSISPESLRTIGCGVPAGAITTNHDEAS